MRRLARWIRPLALAALVAAGTASSPRTANAQFVVFDPSSLAQSLIDYGMQALQLVEAVQSVRHLVRQVTQLDSTYTHMKDAATGRIGQLTDAFSALSSADASLLLDADFGAWRNRLSGTSNSLAGALEDMDGTSLSDYLLNELDSADAINDTDLLGLYPPGDARGTRIAADWTAARERGDRRRVPDLATAEAAGRLFALLEDAQTDIDGRRGQGELSHTALQQAQIANQLTAAEIEFARAQLFAIQAQQDALARHEAELQARSELERWLQREQDAQQRAQDIADAAAARSGTYTAVPIGRLTPPN